MRPDRARFLRPDPGAYRKPAPLPPIDTWPPPNFVSTLATLARNLALVRREWASVRALLQEKANFNPNQPRDDRGRWSDTGAGSDSTTTGSDTPSDRPDAPSPQSSVTALRNRVAKAAIRRLIVMGVREAANPLIGTVLNAADLVDMAREAYPYVRAYFDEPKTLAELQAAVSVREAGYDIHHIVEQTPADRDNFARAMFMRRKIWYGCRR